MLIDLSESFKYLTNYFITKFDLENRIQYCLLFQNSQKDKCLNELKNEISQKCGFHFSYIELIFDYYLHINTTHYCYRDSIEIVNRWCVRNRELAAKIISRYYPLDKEQLSIFEDLLTWDDVFHNKSINWDQELIFKFRGYDDWNYLKWTAKFDEKTIDEHSEYISWGNGYIYSLPLSDQFIEKFKNKIDWEMFSQAFDFTGRPYLYNRYKDRLDWVWLFKYPRFEESLWDSFKENINWEQLTRRLLPIPSFQKQYKGKCEKSISKNNVEISSLNYDCELPWMVSNVCYGKHIYGDTLLNSKNLITWNLEIINKYQEYWDWDILSCYFPLPLSQNVITFFDTYWNWEFLSENPDLPMKKDLIDKYNGCINWSIFSSNQALPFEISFLNEYKELLDWSKLSSRSYGIINWDYCARKSYRVREEDPEGYNPWSIELIRYFADYWNWDILSENLCLPWSEELIIEFEERWNWDKLSSNTSIKFTSSLIQLYQENWDWGNLSRNYVIKWNSDLFLRYSLILNWNYLSHSENTEWNDEVLSLFADRLVWKSICSLKCIKWTHERINKFQDYIDWEELSKSEGVEWTENLILDYAKNYSKKTWHWYYLKRNRSMPHELLDKYSHSYCASWDTETPLFRFLDNPKASLECIMRIDNDITDYDILNELYKRIFSHINIDEITHILTIIKEENKRIQKEYNRTHNPFTGWRPAPGPNDHYSRGVINSAFEGDESATWNID